MLTEFPPPLPPGAKKRALLAELAAYRLTMAALRLKFLTAKEISILRSRVCRPVIRKADNGRMEGAAVGGGGWRLMTGPENSNV